MITAEVSDLKLCL